MALARAVGFAQTFSFKYSARPGTPASTREDQIDEDVKTERLKRLQDLLESQQAAFNASSIGTTLPVLFERKGRHEGQVVGRSPYLQLVHADAAPDMIGRIAPVAIRSASQLTLSGVIEAA